LACLRARSLSGLPEVRPGDDLGALIAQALDGERPPHGLGQGDIVVVAQKAVSKAEGAIVALADVQPGDRARELAARTTAARGGKGVDARFVQVVLDQSAEVMRCERGVIVSRTIHGFVCANAGVDLSNAIEPDTAILLPRDPDASARALRSRLRELTEAEVAVLVTDSFGRAWRHGQCDVAIGCAGLSALEDWRGRTDSVGRELSATWLALADAIAATGELVRAKDSREPVVIVEGLERLVTEPDGEGAAALLRAVDEDLFR
jgi:coenzyme F420-0:L-glutamate ligase / coenzyme F420-1:gamma-L-glutamate ligase